MAVVKLPWTYWPITFVALVLIMAAGAQVGAWLVGSSYVGAVGFGCLFVLTEVRTIQRRRP